MLSPLALRNDPPQATHRSQASVLINHLTNPHSVLTQASLEVEALDRQFRATSQVINTHLSVQLSHPLEATAAIDQPSQAMAAIVHLLEAIVLRGQLSEATAETDQIFQGMVATGQQSVAMEPVDHPSEATAQTVQPSLAMVAIVHPLEVMVPHGHLLEATATTDQL